jgi:hypothetical protein
LILTFILDVGSPSLEARVNARPTDDGLRSGPLGASRQFVHWPAAPNSSEMNSKER